MTVSMVPFITLAILFWSSYVAGLGASFTKDPNVLEPSTAHAPYLEALSPPQRSLFDEVIEALDANFAPPFIFNSPRYSAWYSVGLLARNQGNDVKTASAMIQNTIDFQFKNPADLWFGTFKSDPNAPDPGPLYPPSIYGSYDPNIGLFVCTSWIIVMEEFQHLLSADLVELMKESMYNATVGDGYRVGGVDMDNRMPPFLMEVDRNAQVLIQVYPVYSNPWYMRVMAATYVGNLMGDKNMTMWGNTWAQEAIQEFERFDTLSEFNSGTYAGVTLYALSLWGYMPKNSTIVEKAPEFISKIWNTIGQFYNPSLHTLGGPWDRSYGFNMQKYFAILGAQLTGLVRGSGVFEPIPSPLIGSEHFSDAAAAVLTTVVSRFHDPHVPPGVRSRLVQRNETPHLTQAQAVSPPFDNVSFPRNYTSWNAEGISVGGMEIDGRFVGGAAINPTQNAPAVILWKTPTGQTTWLSHYVTSSSISARASEKNLTITYPPSRAFPDTWSPSNVLVLLISGIPGHPLGSDFGSEGNADLPGIRLSFSGNVATHASRSILYGAATLNDLAYYNLTYTIPDGFGQVPELIISFEKL